MVAKVISGREVAEIILTTDLKNKVLELNKKNIKPKLIVMLVGEMKASASYVAQKEKFAVKAGIESDKRDKPAKSVKIFTLLAGVKYLLTLKLQINLYACTSLI